MLASATFGSVAQTATTTAVQVDKASHATAVAILRSARTVEQFARTYFADIPVMSEIARCESKFRQFDENGNLLRGKVNSGDMGLMQINEKYHSDNATKLGLELETIEDNAAYARWLYNREGTDPWISSIKCWGKNKNNAAPTTTDSVAKNNKTIKAS